MLLLLGYGTFLEAVANLSTASLQEELEVRIDTGGQVEFRVFHPSFSEPVLLPQGGEDLQVCVALEGPVSLVGAVRAREFRRHLFNRYDL